jgi:hypothetical protein
MTDVVRVLAAYLRAQREQLLKTASLTQISVCHGCCKSQEFLIVTFASHFMTESMAVTIAKLYVLPHDEPS